MDEQQNWGIAPCDKPIDISKGYHELELDSTQKIQIGGLLQQIPSAAVAGEMPNFYTISFPHGGTPEQLMKLNDGTGYTTSVMGENGIKTQAAINPMNTQALILGCFTIMSIASSQYFLKRIGNELEMMRMGLDKIIEFLYGEKKAELMSEVSFVKYAYRNYASIMKYDQQRTATIGSLHDAKKIAMKDIEFYINDLDSIISEKGANAFELSEKSFQIKESLEISMQLYGMSSVLEVYYSQNFEPDYLKYTENDISIYFNKCEKRLLSIFSSLKVIVENAKGSQFKKIPKSTVEEHIDEFIESLSQGEKSEIRKIVDSSLRIAMRKHEYYIKNDGSVYLKENISIN